MAFQLENEDIQVPVQAAQPAPSRNETTQHERKRSIGFNPTEFNLMSTTQGSTYTDNIFTTMVNMYKESAESIRPKVSKLDKEMVSGIAYSTIVVSRAYSNAVYYFTILLEATGRAPMKASDVVQELSNSVKSNQKAFIFTPDQAIDKLLHGMIQKQLKVEYGTAINEFISVDGLVISNVEPAELTTVVNRVAPVAINALNVEIKISNKESYDLNLADTKAANQILKIEANFNNPTSFDQTRRPIRTDWVVDLLKINTDNEYVSLNVSDSRQTLASVRGFIDAIPTDIEEVTYTGQRFKRTKIRPHIIITSNDVLAPTVGFGLLGIVSSLVMTSKDMYVYSEVPRNGRTPAGLNMIVNLENDPSGVGAVTEINSKKYSNSEVYDIIGKIFSLDPMVSMDVASFGPQTSYLSIFATAAAPKQNDHTVAARKEIIAAASRLTNGLFPIDFDPNSIFKNAGIILPLGTWADKTGERDTRDIDLAWIMNNKGDMKLASDYVLSGTPREAGNNQDNFIGRVAVLNAIIPDAIIDGKLSRVTFHPDFIRTLSSAILSSGFDVRYDPEIVYTENAGIGIAGDFYSNAGVTNASGFAKHNYGNTNQQNYQTPYSGMGYGRF